MGLLLPTPNGPPAASGSAVYDLYDQKGILEAANLPVLPPDRDYQLWLIDPNISVPVSGAVFGVNERGYVRLEYTPTTRLRNEFAPTPAPTSQLCVPPTSAQRRL